jgi:hypothetical protein
MKTKYLKIVAITALPAALLAVTSCSSNPKGGVQSTSTTQTKKGVPGGSVVQTHKTTATVAAVDALTRHITLQTADGRTEVVKAGPEVANFDQIQVGDKVNVTLTEQLVVFLQRGGDSGGSGSRERTVAVAPAGAKPGVVMADTIETSAKLVGIDQKQRVATLQFPDGTIRTVMVRPDVDMTKAKLGDTVVIRSTEEMAVKVEKP